MIKRILFLYVFICFQIYSQTISLDIIEKNNIQYFSINEFIYKNNLKSTYYQAKEKLEILYEGNKIYFSPSIFGATRTYDYVDEAEIRLF